MTAAPPVVFLCGPRAGGNSDTAGLAFAKGVARSGREPRIIALREHAVAPCRGCGACSGGRRRCPLDTADDEAEALFGVLDAAPFVAFASPIYFYHLPALFKAFIDRAQRRYEIRAAGGELPGVGGPDAAARPVYPLLVAGRPRGERLFEGALLTLKYFLWPFHLALAKPSLWRGMDVPGDLAGDAAGLAALADLGEAAGR